MPGFSDIRFPYCTRSTRYVIKYRETLFHDLHLNKVAYFRCAGLVAAQTAFSLLRVSQLFTKISSSCTFCRANLFS